jgi:hypothetical protein
MEQIDSSGGIVEEQEQLSKQKLKEHMNEVFGPAVNPKENNEFLVYLLEKEKEDLKRKSCKTVKTFVQHIFGRNVTVEQVRRARMKLKSEQRWRLRIERIHESMAQHHLLGWENKQKQPRKPEPKKDAAVQTELEEQEGSSLAPRPGLCIICYSSPPAVLFRPCLHHVVCFECWSSCDEKDKCVLCRQKLAFLGTLMTYGP